MRKILSTFTLTGLLFCSVYAQKITLEDVITKNTFRQKTIEGVKSSVDGLNYTTLENRTQIVRYSYKTGQKNILLNVQDLKNDTLKYIEDYSFSPNESQVLLMTGKKPVHRHSYTAQCFVYSFVTKELKRLSTGTQQVASFSPDGERIAFVRDNNLFIKSLRFGTERQITNDGAFNKIINGIPDWVYEEEFEFTKAYEWSPDSKQLAFIKFNEEKVAAYKWMIYKGSKPKFLKNDIFPP